jgi:hypothetical protein
MADLCPWMKELPLFLSLFLLWRAAAAALPEFLGILTH